MDNKKSTEDIIKDLLVNLNIDVESESTKRTPERMARMFNELLAGLNPENYFKLKEDFTCFNPDNSGKPITVKNIKFYSLCEHHFLPFFGYVDITYTPRDKQVGLSKLPRAVDFFSRKPQTQEKLTREIGTFLVGQLVPNSLYVKVHDVRHMCVEMRGIKSTECSTDTEYFYGVDLCSK